MKEIAFTLDSGEICYVTSSGPSSVQVNQKITDTKVRVEILCGKKNNKPNNYFNSKEEINDFLSEIFYNIDKDNFFTNESEWRDNLFNFYEKQLKGVEKENIEFRNKLNEALGLENEKRIKIVEDENSINGYNINYSYDEIFELIDLYKSKMENVA